MLKTFRIALLALLTLATSQCVAAASACPPAPEQPSAEAMQAAMQNAHDHGFLWRISKDGHTSYLYGTMHVGRLEWAVPGANVMQALRAADTVALELDSMDPDIQSRIAAGMAAMKHVALPDALVQRLHKQADAVCLPYDALARLSPEMQVTMLTLMVGRWDGLDASYAMDSVLAGIGHGAGKDTVSLETPEMQLRMLQMQDAQDVVPFVEDNLEELESGRARAMLARIAKAWAGADYAEMEHFDQWCECYKTEVEREEMKQLLDERNPGLAEHIDALHRSGKRVFAAVGSLHMFGPIGLPALMAKRGYKVERVELRPM